MTILPLHLPIIFMAQAMVVNSVYSIIFGVSFAVQVWTKKTYMCFFQASTSFPFALLVFICFWSAAETTLECL